MADKSHTLILDALRKAAAVPAGLALFRGRSAGGLFSKSGAGKRAAQSCQDQGYLRVQHAVDHGRKPQDIGAITEKGLAYLLSAVSPKPVLEALVAALQARQTQVDEVSAGVARLSAQLSSLRHTAEKVLQQLGRGEATPPPSDQAPTSANGADRWHSVVLDHLLRHDDRGALEDCPLPDLYRRARQAAPHLTVGQFHDGLRRLHERAQIRLHPWTGPLYEMPEPSLALLLGHEIAYYARRRD